MGPMVEMVRLAGEQMWNTSRLLCCWTVIANVLSTTVMSPLLRASEYGASQLGNEDTALSPSGDVSRDIHERRGTRT